MDKGNTNVKYYLLLLLLILCLNIKWPVFNTILTISTMAIGSEQTNKKISSDHDKREKSILSEISKLKSKASYLLKLRVI